MSAKTIEAARIAGALKCMDALLKLEHDATHAVEWAGSEQTAAEYYDQRLSDARALVAALGPMTPEQEGAIAVLAEYIHMSITSGQPTLESDGWIPLSAMTDKARQAMVEQLDAEHEADNAAIAAARKVVSIADRMPVR